jgi:long-chain fatty acid transport protein
MQFRAQAGPAPRGRRWTAAAVYALAAASALAAPARRAAAQAFGLNELGSCAIARGFATTGAPCDDASTLYWNPAAATSLRGLSIYAGAAAVSVTGSFTADTTGRRYPGDIPLEVPPFLGVNWKPERGRYALGVAAYVPYGLTTQWRPDFIGRFSAQKAALLSVYVQPNLAVDLIPGRLSVGGGPTLGWSRLELRQSIDLAGQHTPGGGPTFAALGVAPFTEFAQVVVKGSATGVGYNLGAHARLTESLTIGARYLSEVKFAFEGADATFTQVNTGLQIYPGSPLRSALPAATPPNAIVPLDQLLGTQFQPGGLLAPGQQAGTTLDYPAQVQVGVGFTGIPRTTLAIDYARVMWGTFRELHFDFGASSPLSRVIIEDYEDINSVRVGAEHRFGDSALGGLLADVVGRVGFSTAPSPAPDESVTPLLPDMDRYDLTAGVGIPLGRALTLDAAYLRVETEGRRGRVVERTSRAQTAAQLNTGWYGLNANIFSLSLKAQF